MNQTLAIAPSAGSEAYRFRNQLGQIVAHSSVPRNDEEAYDEACYLAIQFGYDLVFIERRVYELYPWKPTWVNLLFYWDQKAGELAA